VTACYSLAQRPSELRRIIKTSRCRRANRVDCIGQAILHGFSRCLSANQWHWLLGDNERRDRAEFMLSLDNSWTSHTMCSNERQNVLSQKLNFGDMFTCAEGSVRLPGYLFACLLNSSKRLKRVLMKFSWVADYYYIGFLRQLTALVSAEVCDVWSFLVCWCISC